MIEFIADVSGNHNGDLERCHQLIREAARVGCSGIRFSLFRVEQLFAPQVLKVSPLHRLKRRRELPLRFLPKLSDWARENGLTFGLQVHDLDTVDTVQSQVDSLAVSPYELPWLDLIDRCADSGLPLVLDTGMAEAGEAWNAVQTALEAGSTDLTVLRSVARYPAPEQVCNLASLGTLREMLMREFAPLYQDTTLKAGWSDHSVSPGVIARAINHWGCDMVTFGLDLDGEGDSFQRGDCWLPDRIGEVIAGGFLPVRRESDGTGRLAPDLGELEERQWRADPDDGLRPVTAQRKSWAGAQPEATRRGPDIYLVCDGPGDEAAQRCLALAEHLRDDHDADILFLVTGQPRLNSTLERHGFNWARFESTASVVSQITFLNNITGDEGPPVCLIDTGPSADQLAAELHVAGILTVVIGAPPCPDADLVLVPHLGWREIDCEPLVIGGNDYLLIPGDVMALRERRPFAGPPSSFPHVVVCFGAVDPEDRTTPILTALQATAPQATVQAVLDTTADHHGVVAQILESRFPASEIISTGDPVEPVLATADIVITGPGQTALVSLCLGIPVLVLAVEESTNEQTKLLASSGAVVDLGLLPGVTDNDLTTRLQAVFSDPERLSRLRFHAQELAGGPLDGYGAARAADRIAQLYNKRRP